MTRWAAGVMFVLSTSLGVTFAAAPPPPTSVGAVPANTPLGSGPHRAIMEMDPGLPGFTVYRPANLRSAGLLPIVAWGNGACVNAGNAFRWFLSDIASYGYLIIALGPIVEGNYPRASHLFVGPDCGLCVNPHWVVRAKNLQ